MNRILSTIVSTFIVGLVCISTANAQAKAEINSVIGEFRNQIAEEVKAD